MQNQGSQNYDALSDIDDEFLASPDSPGPVPVSGVHLRDTSSYLQDHNEPGGHFISGPGRTSTSAVNSASQMAGNDGWSNAPINGQNTFQDRVQMVKNAGMGFASFLRDRTVKATSTIKQRADEADWSKQQQVFDRVKEATRGVTEKVQQAGGAAGTWMYATSKQAADMTNETIQRWRGNSLAVVCRNEGAARPCPRALLVCCTALVTGGLNTEGLFLQNAPEDLVHNFLNAVMEGHGVVLPAPGTSPRVIAGALKQFLITLPEPLLTYKLLPEFIHAGRGGVGLERAGVLLVELPPANASAVSLLLETCHRVAGNAAVNEMDARALAGVFAPLVAWHPPPKDAKKYLPLGSGTPRSGSFNAPEPDHASVNGSLPDTPSSLARTELEDDELQAIAKVLEHLIAAFRSMNSTNTPLYAAS